MIEDIQFAIPDQMSYPTVYIIRNPTRIHNMWPIIHMSHANRTILLYVIFSNTQQSAHST